MSDGGDSAKEEIPTKAVLNWEDRLGDKLSKLEVVVICIRDALLGAQPQADEQGKTAESGDGFFSEIQRRLKRDCAVVDSIANIAHEIQQSLGNVNVPTP